MIVQYLSALWTAIAPALGNHLWQSTVFALAAALLTLALRKNHARVRYGLWLAASVKFLVPFSLLVSLGSHLAWTPRTPAAANANFYIVMEEVSQPFTPTAMPALPPSAPTTFFSTLAHLLPALLATAWVFGFVSVLFVWCARWRRISKALRNSSPLEDDREVEALRRMERVAAIRWLIELRLSRTSLEPGVFGIIRPVLVWPAGLSARLEDAHLDAILAHEVWHVRRRDNLAAALHMVVEAVFWFHPLVWWMGARLVAERERACDEAVLEMNELGGGRQIYAESILKVCEFCVGSSLACVAGVTGADLKKRIAYIMTKHVARKLDFGRKLLLSAAALVAVAVPIVFGLVRPMQGRAEAAATNAATTPLYDISIKPNKSGGSHSESWVGFNPDGGFTAGNITLQRLIQEAYNIEDGQILEGPDWFRSERYNIDARISSSLIDELLKLSPEQQALFAGQRLVQPFLADHFKLTLHRETRTLPQYELLIAEKGPKVKKAKAGDTYSNGIKDDHGRSFGPGLHTKKGSPLIGQGVPIAELARELSDHLNFLVVDKTGLLGNYDFTVQFPEHQGGTPNPLPALLTAIREQLGLKLERQTAPVDVLVIDHVEKPSNLQAQNTYATASRYQPASMQSGKALVPSGAEAQSSHNPVLKQGISVKMPVARHAAEMRAADETNAMVITITQDRKVFAGIEPTDPDALGKLRQRTIYVKADPRVPYQKVLAILDALRGRSVVLLTAPPQNVAGKEIVPPYGMKLTVSR